MNEITSQETNNEIINKQKLADYLTSFGLAEQLTKKEASQFIEIAQAFNLNPFKREIYCIVYGEGEKRKLSILTGYEVYLKRAERTGLLDGWRAWTEGNIEPKTIIKKIKKRDGGTWDKEVQVWQGNLKAVVEIYRKDRSRPFIHEVLFSEYTQDNEMWGSKPQTMIKKVAIGQAFRLAFPDECAGMPYTAEETQEIEENQIQQPQQSQAQPKASAKQAPKDDAIPTQAEEVKDDPQAKVFQETWTEVIKEVATILGAKDAPEAWTQEERDTIEAKTIPHKAKEAKDESLLKALLYRARIGHKVRGTEDWAKIMPQVVAMGTDLDSLEAVLVSLSQPKHPGTPQATEEAPELEGIY